MSDFKAHIDTLYQALHATDENVKVQHARKLYQDLVGAPPLSAEDRIESLKHLNQQLQDQVTEVRRTADGDAERKWKAKHDTLKRDLEHANTRLAALSGNDTAAAARARLHTRLRSRLSAARHVLANLEALEGTV